MLSKLGAINAADATTALTAIMNGYKMSVEDASHVVDSLVAVDMAAATSTDELRNALQRTSNTARDAGVGYETLVGYIGTVSETTRLASESIGTAFRTLFTRFQNIKVGKFVDAESGEALNDVEKVLGKLGIKLRTTATDWRKVEDVISDVATRWESFNQTEKNAIATSAAG